MGNQFDLSELHTIGLKSHFAWLKNLPIQISRIANFGCRSSEPFAIKSITGARRVFVVEIDRAGLTKSFSLPPIEEYELLQRNYPNQFGPSSIFFIQADICNTPLYSECVEFCYCEDLLYYIADDQAVLLSAIQEMARIVRKNGIVVAIEQKLGVEYDEIRAYLGEFPVPRNEPLDISELFESVGLEKISVAGSTEHSYCYSKPESS